MEDKETQTESIKGVVIGSNDNPLPDVSVSEMGKVKSVYTDSEGNFVVNLKHLPATLSFVCPGYVPYEQTFGLDSGNVTIRMYEEIISYRLFLQQKGHKKQDHWVINIMRFLIPFDLLNVI